MITKGEWGIGQNKFGDYLIIATDGLKHSVVADIHQVNDNAEANARLIASSPDLLEALKEAQGYIARIEIYKHEQRTPLEEKMIKAIAKAES